jgi:hypothetical protein
MIVVQVGVKLNVKFMVAAPYKKHQNGSTHLSHTGVELDAKQLNIFEFNR